MNAPSYDLPAGESSHEIIVVNSRFIATLAPVESVEAARAFIHTIKQRYADATHNVPAYLIGHGNSVTEYCSDDGEPSGTAGRPALAVLHGSGLGDACLVVTRYFGGTLLGTGGLVKAYTQSAQEVIQRSARARRIEVATCLLALPYPLFDRVKLLAHSQSGKVLDSDFAADITLTLQFPTDRLGGFQRALSELSNGQLQAEVIEKRFTLVKIT